MCQHSRSNMARHCPIVRELWKWSCFASHGDGDLSRPFLWHPLLQVWDEESCKSYVKEPSSCQPHATRGEQCSLIHTFVEDITLLRSQSYLGKEHLFGWKINLFGLSCIDVDLVAAAEHGWRTNILAVTEVRIASVFGMLLVRIESLAESCMLGEMVRASSAEGPQSCMLYSRDSGRHDGPSWDNLNRAQRVSHRPKNKFVGWSLDSIRRQKGAQA